MIITIALNPGIEKLIELSSLTIGESQDIDSYQLRIARSSVHSAYIMKLLQGEPYVLGFAGGIGGRYIKNFLDKSRIKSDFITKDKELESAFILKLPGQQATILMDHGTKLAEEDVRNFKHKLVRHLSEGELIVLNGDTYDGTARRILSETIDLAHKEQKRVVLSLEGESFKEFLSHQPYALIMDRPQLMSLTDTDMSELEVARFLHGLIKEHQIHYIYYLLEDGIMGVSKNKISIARDNQKPYEPLKWRKEAIAGGVAIGIKRKYEFERILKLSNSIGSAISEMAYPVLCQRKEIDTILNQTKLTEIYSKGIFHVKG